MVLIDEKSKLCAHGFSFRNWPGPGEEAAASFGLSHAVIVPPNVRTVIVGGQVGIADDGSVPEDLAAEVREAFEHVGRALRAAGLGEDAWEYVYKITTFEVSTPGLLDVVLSTAAEYLKETKPAWTGIGVAGLVHPALHIEITVEAYLPETAQHRL
ncbi:RutC family protein YjgH [Lasiodiplodia hormozganensis]|uniref:RutC family protein YjgH n=1 Tax=Lasiodiplodia hormozganensis TaxID=869390 RepID=A0AA39XQH2_9PEZI|nr:RutC family protein YjgH [Lasiodiplodia hormozganensis]